METEDNDKFIGDFMGVPPEVEYQVGSAENNTVCYSPKNVGSYFTHPEQQKAECERFLKEQADKYPDGWVTKEGHEVIKSEWYPYYQGEWGKLMTVVEKIESLGFEFNIKCEAAWVRRTYFKANFPDDISEVGESKKSATYNTAVKFITWYNQNKSHFISQSNNRPIK